MNTITVLLGAETPRYYVYIQRIYSSGQTAVSTGYPKDRDVGTYGPQRNGLIPIRQWTSYS